MYISESFLSIASEISRPPFRVSATAKIYTRIVDEVFEQNRKRLQEYAEHKQERTGLSQ